ncbi:hypothetical protein BO71DRAFT_433113 [Aspergillus ellipticus CBS 707.79]|uniref:LysM domain-containing protein n=1 Tax=Aspergillus ellipticus CBS 707.79 TaxID=1448320 RepID=A0A319D101_9EURO|nr:hypothetical protein BO71DRAFT_433113 [Aspergillus ellipticus CBS 707.79]
MITNTTLPVDQANEDTHTVQTGETLDDVAADHYGNRSFYTMIEGANGITDHKIHPGQTVESEDFRHIGATSSTIVQEYAGIGGDTIVVR